MLRQFGNLGQQIIRIVSCFRGEAPPPPTSTCYTSAMRASPLSLRPFGLVSSFWAWAFAFLFPHGAWSACDDAILTDSLLLPQAQRLADFRNSFSGDDVEKACVLTVEDLVRKYPHPGHREISVLEGLQPFLIQAERPFRYLTLFGDASSTPGSDRDHVPTFYYRDIDSKGDTLIAPYDWAYARLAVCSSCLDIFRDSIPYRRTFFEMNPPLPAALFAVGRIPAHTVAEATTYVDKVIAYETKFPFGPWSQTWGFVADDNRRMGGPEPIWDMPALGQVLWDSLRVKPFVRRLASIEFPLASDTANPGANDSLMKMWNQGLGMLFFVGHGNPRYWTDEHVFDLHRDLSKLQNGHRLPIVYTLACTTAPFATDSILSMGEALILQPERAIAFIGSQFENYPYPNNELAKAWISHATDKQSSIGESFRLALSRNGVDWTANDDTYDILGDPALSLHWPETQLEASASATRANPSFITQAQSGDSLALEIVQMDSVAYKTYGPDGSLLFEDVFRFYERETTVYRETRALSPTENEIQFSISNSLNASKHAIKILVWNSKGMRYGYFPLDHLPNNTLAIQKGGRPGETRRYRLSRADLSGAPGLRRSGLKGQPGLNVLGRHFHFSSK